MNIQDEQVQGELLIELVCKQDLNNAENVEAIKTILRLYPNISLNISDGRGGSLAMIMIRRFSQYYNNSNVSLLKCLLDASPSQLHQADDKDRTLMHYASKTGDYQVMQLVYIYTANANNLKKFILKSARFCEYRLRVADFTKLPTIEDIRKQFDELRQALQEFKSSDKQKISELFMSLHKNIAVLIDLNIGDFSELLQFYHILQCQYALITQDMHSACKFAEYINRVEAEHRNDILLVASKFLSATEVELDLEKQKQYDQISLKLFTYCREEQRYRLEKNEVDNKTLLFKIFTNACLQPEDIKMVKEILQHNPHFIESIDRSGDTLAICAALHGHSDLLNLLIEFDSRVLQQVDSTGCSLASLAAKNGHLNILQLLTGIFPSVVKHVTQGGNTLAMLAVVGGNYDVFAWVLDQYPESIKQANNAGFTPAMYATMYKHLNMLQLLFTIDATVENTTDSNNHTLAMIAARSDSLNVLQFLISRNSTLLQKTDGQGRTLAMIAAMYGSCKVLSWLIEIHEAPMMLSAIREDKLEKFIFIHSIKIADKLTVFLNKIVLPCDEETPTFFKQRNGNQQRHALLIPYVQELQSNVQCHKQRKCISTKGIGIIVDLLNKCDGVLENDIEDISIKSELKKFRNSFQSMIKSDCNDILGEASAKII